MTNYGIPSTAELRDVFQETVDALGGAVKEVFDDGQCLFGRSVLPWKAEVSSGDEVQAGVAIRGLDGEVAVHPYVFRQVCRNGAILAQSVGTRQVEWIEGLDPGWMIAEVREAIQACAEPMGFHEVVTRLSEARHTEVNVLLNLTSHLTSLPPELTREILERVTREYARGGDDSRYGFINAVTAVARETRDPRGKWELEVLGGRLMTEEVGPRVRPERVCRVREGMLV